jgi:hypothetical protein
MVARANPASAAAASPSADVFRNVRRVCRLFTGSPGRKLSL